MLISSFIINNILSAPKPILKILKTFVFLKKKCLLLTDIQVKKTKTSFMYYIQYLKNPVAWFIL